MKIVSSRTDHLKAKLRRHAIVTLTLTTPFHTKLISKRSSNLERLARLMTRSRQEAPPLSTLTTPCSWMLPLVLMKVITQLRPNRESINRPLQARPSLLRMLRRRNMLKDSLRKIKSRRESSK